MNASSRVWIRAFDRDAREQIIEFAFFDHDVILTRLEFGNAKYPAVQSLVELAEPRAVEEQNFQRCSPFTEEHEERARPSPRSDALLHQTRQSVEAQSKIDRRQGDE